MDKQLFESTVAEFLNKANVILLKKGVDFNDDDNLPPYILLDSNRKSLYLAETDLFISDIQNDNININEFAENNNINTELATTVISIGKDFSLLPDDFQVNSYDISKDTVKTALIISNENKGSIIDYLNSSNIKFQSANYKNILSVFFFDVLNSSIFKNNYNSLLPKEQVVEEKPEEDEDIAPVFDPNKKDENTVSDNTENTDTLKNDEKKETVFENIPVNNDTGIKYEPEDNEDDTLNPDEEAQLNNLNLDEILKPKTQEDEPKDDIEAELLYGKVLKEQAEKDSADKHINNAKEIKEIYNDGPSKDVVFNNTTNDSTNENVKTEQKHEKFSKLDIINKIFANISGIIFFLPAYVLNKLLKRFIPPFLIYWIASVPAVFGVYQLIFSLFPRPLGSVLESTITNTHNSIGKISAKFAENIDNSSISALDIINQNEIFFINQKEIFNMLSSNGGLLHYLLGVSAVLMIIPAFRKMGKTLTIFSILSYLLIPSIVKLESIIVNKLSSFTDISNTAYLLNMTVNILPFLIFAVILYVSSQLVPNSDKRKEVLP